MNKKNKVLFLLGDIWSLGKNKGMPSIFKVLENSDESFDTTIFTTDKNEYSKELPNSTVFYFQNEFSTFSKNRYLIYLNVRVSNLVLNLKYIYKFIKLKDKFDVVYCSSSIPIYATWFIRKFYKVKTIHRIYGTFLYPNLSSKLDKIKKFEEVLSFKLKADKYIITNDGTYGDKVAEYFNIKSDKILFIRNGVDKIDVNKDEIKSRFKLNENHFNCMCVSRLVGWKRVDRIVSAFNKIDNSSIKLYVIGDGEELDRLKELSINENIIFLGSLPSSDVHGLMNCMNCFISMYDISNVGNPLLEALVYNMPIITYNSGNTKDVINEKNGILIESSNEETIIDELYQYIIEFYKNKTLVDKLSKGAEEYAKNNLYSWNKRIDIEIQEIEKVCGER